MLIAIGAFDKSGREIRFLVTVIFILVKYEEMKIIWDSKISVFLGLYCKFNNGILM